MINFRGIDIRTNTLYQIVLHFFIVIFLISCASYKPMEKEPLLNEQNLSLDTKSQTWWKDFNNSKLNTLMQEALDKNLDLLAAQSRIKQASYSLIIAEALKYPDLGLSLGASYTVNHFENKTIESNDITGSLEASYEVDLWGRIASLNEATIHEYKQKEFDYQSIQVMLSSSLVTNWYDLAYTFESEKLLKKRIVLSQKEIELLKRRYQVQRAKIVDLLSQESTLKQLELDLTSLRFQKHAYKNALFSLMSKSPEDSSLFEGLSLPVNILTPSLIVPSDALLKRPDIRAAYETLKAQDAKSAAAVSAQYPRFSLSASIQQNDMSFNNLFDLWYTRLAVSMFTPLFDAGVLKAEAKTALEKRRELLLNLKQLFINASVEVSNALKDIQTQKRNYLLVKEQLIIDEKKEASYHMYYLYGTEDFKRYLDSKIALYLTQEREIKIRLNLIKAYVTLYRVTSSAWSDMKEKT